LNGRALTGLIFDLDGVLVNTVDLHYRAWKQLFDELGVSFSPHDMNRLRGVHRRDILLSLAADLTEDQIALYLTQKDRLYLQVLDEARQDILHQPAVALLREARARGWKVGLASSSINARYVLELVGLANAFDAIADGNTVCRSKPCPDIFVWVAGALGVKPAEIAVIEDSSAGVQGALDAGMFVVGIDVTVPEGARPPHLNLTLDTLTFDALLSESIRA
jgi:beta-phosphoglucomutase